MFRALFGIAFFPVIVLLDVLFSPVKVSLKQSVKEVSESIMDTM